MVFVLLSSGVHTNTSSTCNISTQNKKKSTFLLSDSFSLIYDNYHGRFSYSLQSCKQNKLFLFHNKGLPMKAMNLSLCLNLVCTKLNYNYKSFLHIAIADVILTQLNFSKHAKVQSISLSCWKLKEIFVEKDNYYTRLIMKSTCRKFFWIIWAVSVTF